MLKETLQAQVYNSISFFSPLAQEFVKKIIVSMLDLVEEDQFGSCYFPKAILIVNCQTLTGILRLT